MPLLSNVSEIDMAWYTVTFTINETKETFSAKFISENFRGDCIKLGVGAYIICDIQVLWVGLMVYHSHLVSKNLQQGLDNEKKVSLFIYSDCNCWNYFFHKLFYVKL